MSTAVAPVESPVAADPRMAAFLAPGCSEVFHSIATPTEIWKADPYDVETIHADARAVFEHLLYRAGRTPPPPSGAVLVLKGEAGSGKTHLMRAFRTRAHGHDLAYCAYLQMTSEASNYGRYMLSNVIDGLEQPYDPSGTSQRTGIARLSAALLESVPGLSGPDMEAFRDGEREFDPTRLVNDYADRVQNAAHFRSCDLELLRVMLHLERGEPQVHSRALMWLRCQEMRPQDREWIGGAIPRTDAADPMKMLQQLARLTDAVHGVPLVLLIDQLEDMANQSAPVERFLKVIDAITAFTDTIPNTVVVLACLEDYFKENVERLNRAKQDRLLRDPEPIRLLGTRTLDEIREMTASRLAYLYDTAEVDIDPTDELYPFRDEHLHRLNNMRSRNALDILAGTTSAASRRAAGKSRGTLRQRRRLRRKTTSTRSGTTFTLRFKRPYPMAKRIWPVSSQTRSVRQRPSCPTAFTSIARLTIDTWKSKHTSRMTASTNCSLPCATRARAALRSASRLPTWSSAAGEVPVAIVRTTAFPKSGKAATQIAGMLKRHGRTAIVADSDWRRMQAFEAFQTRYAIRPDFAAWQKTARPLGELDSLQRILRLSALSAIPRAPIIPPPAVIPTIRDEPSPRATDASVRSSFTTAGPLILGRILGVTQAPVTFEPNEFVQHAAFLGGSGSGKTTAALNLIEQLLARDVPAVLLDRKGDLCRYADRSAWERPLADPARAKARKALRAKLDVVLFTPGEPNGRPLVLPVVPPGFDQLPEADRERFAQYAAGALGSMIGFKSADADKAQRAILAKAIETMATVPGAAITVPALRTIIAERDDALLNAIGGGFPDKFYAKLAERLLTLELNNKQLLTGGERLDVDALLGTGPHSRPGRVRLSVISTRFLGDPAKVNFWVSQLLVAVSRWCASSPQPRLQAVFLFDEADLYLPAGMKQPATKAPMEDLLKRARSAGVGVFLATQSPGDFDYKCKENVRTWLIGRVKEPRALEKLKPMLAAAKGNVSDKLPGQATGEFYLVRESNITAVRSDESFMRTEQLAESEIARLARLPV